MVGLVVAKIWLGEMPRKRRQPYFTRRGLVARRDILLYSQYQGVVAGVDAERSLVLYVCSCERNLELDIALSYESSTLQWLVTMASDISSRRLAALRDEPDAPVPAR